MSEDLETRIDNLIKFSKGTMPVGIAVASKTEAAKAMEILQNKRGGKIVNVCVVVDGYVIVYKPDYTD